MPGFEELWFNRRDAITVEVEDMVNKALRMAGWKHTSQTPGSYWMWEKEFDGVTYRVAQHDAERIQEHFDRKDYFIRFPDELGD